MSIPLSFHDKLTREGYTTWAGIGECPVEKDEYVDVVYQDGRDCRNCLARDLYWGRQQTHPEITIIAYRLHQPTITTGVKHDSGKPRFSLLPLKQIETVVAVLEFGARKYAPGNWQKVENPRDRYFDAAMRHVFAWRNGEKLDQETQLPHLAHAVCCLLFLMWGDDQK